MSIKDYLSADKVLFKVILSLIAILSFISMITSLFIIGIYIFKKSSRTTIFKYIIMLMGSEVLNSISKFLSVKRLFSSDTDLMLPNFQDSICIVQRFCGIYSDICSFILLIVLSLYAKTKMFHNGSKLGIISISLIAFVTPFVFSLA